MDEFTFHNFHNRHCSFTMIDGTVVHGVAFFFSFSDEKPNSLYFVKSYDLIEFSAAQSVQDWDRCKNLATPFSFEQIKEARLLN